MKFSNIFTSKHLLLFFLALLLSGKIFSASTNITSSIRIDQTWINANAAPWTISRNSVRVTFSENLVVNNVNQYFQIIGSNVIIDGANKIVTISGVTNYTGLVNASESNASTAIVKNIGVYNTNNSTLAEYQGYISGNSNNATILNCYSTGQISTSNIGGIVGGNNNGSISNCYSTGAISGDYSGGIAAPAHRGLISNCYSTGVISGLVSGGIVAWYIYGEIRNCYSTGLIVGSEAHGIVPIDWGPINNVFYENGSSWNNTNANSVLTGLNSVWNTTTTPYTLLEPLSSLLSVSIPDASLTSCSGTTSTPTTFSVSGSNLTASVTISAPTYFEISTSSGGSYSSSLTLPQTSTVSQTLYVRLNSSATFGINSGTITATSIDASDVATTVSGTVFAKPTLSFNSISLCNEATYLITKTTSVSNNDSWTVSGTITVNNGYVTAGTTPGTYSVSYTDGCAQTVSASVNVAATSTLPAITDGLASYKFNNNPQGPLGSGDVIYMGYNGFNYSSTIRPTNTGFYRANNVSGSSAGSPTQFYIFRCTTCGTVPEYATRPQGTLTGNSILPGSTGQLTYTSSNGGGPFTIVYLPDGGSNVTVNNISSTVAFNVVTPTITTSYKLISVTDEKTNASADFSGISTSITIPYIVGQSALGGKIAYILQSGDPGYDANVQHGLVATVTDISTGTQWGCSGTDLPGASGTTIGTGNQNTIDIMAGCATAGIAARLCGDLVQGGYSDWYLPSKNELEKLHLNRTAIGGFTNNLYWSSSETEFDNLLALYVNFVNGAAGYGYKTSTNYVRAIRAF